MLTSDDIGHIPNRNVPTSIDDIGNHTIVNFHTSIDIGTYSNRYGY